MKHILSALLLFAAASLLAACGNIIETSSSDELTGQWQLLTIDTIDTGGRLEMKEDRKYFSIEHDLVWIHDADGGQGFMASYEYTDSLLSLYHFTRYTHGMSYEPEVTDVAELRPYGINNLEATFRITLGDSKMVLDNDTLRITLRQF